MQQEHGRAEDCAKDWTGKVYMAFESGHKEEHALRYQGTMGLAIIRLLSNKFS